MKMNVFCKKIAFVLIVTTIGTANCAAQFNLKRAVQGATKAAQAMTLTDEQMAQYVKEFIDATDKNNKVCADDSEYAVRLKKMTEGLTDADGIKLNFKVYHVTDVNAFACPDGSIRVFSGLMDIMSDEELLGVIGHEIGHIANRDSKDAFKNSLMTSALKDGVASTGGKAAALSDSQIASLGTALLSARYSQKQEHEADEYGYQFLKKGGKNPWGMALAFEKLKELEANAGAQKSSKINQLFSTHPDLDARIKKMSDKAQSEGIKKPTSANKL